MSRAIWCMSVDSNTSAIRMCPLLFDQVLRLYNGNALLYIFFCSPRSTPGWLRANLSVFSEVCFYSFSDKNKHQFVVESHPKVFVSEWWSRSHAYWFLLAWMTAPIPLEMCLQVYLNIFFHQIRCSKGRDCTHALVRIISCLSLRWTSFVVLAWMTASVSH